MKWWNDIKNYFYKRSLEQRITQSKPQHAIINMPQVHTVGIVFDSTNPANDSAVLSFAEQLKSAGKEVELLGFVNDKKTESKPGITIFNRKALNWLDIPTTEPIESFAQKKFDLLLACFTGEHLTLEYLTAISNARWRVGAYAENKTGFYDMMINVGDKTDLQYLLDQSVYFLNYIKAA